ncbi:MAG: YicC/YloC family endoribonuclease [Porphyromonas sp.]|nr:YicC/YloC family endoribonuclease [Porphyromonas sp.]
MILSMTGVGKTIVRHEGKSITIFIKTLNSKQIDISTRLPYAYRERDLEVRTLATNYLVRGKVEISISLDDLSAGLSGVQHINAEALQHYIKQIQSALNGVRPTFEYMESLLRLPGVLVSGETTQQELSEEEWAAVRRGLEEALQAVVDYRRQEGAMLESVLSQRIATIRTLLAEVDLPEGERIAAIRQRLEDGLRKLEVEGYDKGRLEQELIYYIERLDVNEEKDRLRHHLSYFESELAKAEGQQGKTLGFVAQEIGREINTLGSKSNNAEMQQIVVRMKDELEQIKEQALNVL